KEHLTASVEPPATTRGLVPFQGPYVYVHCAFEKYRPTIIKEYPRVARKSLGVWPQFRSATAGKCPFVEDPGAVQCSARDLERKTQVRVQQLEAEKRRLARLTRGEGRGQSNAGGVGDGGAGAGAQAGEAAAARSATKRTWAEYQAGDRPAAAEQAQAARSPAKAAARPAQTTTAAAQVSRRPDVLWAKLDAAARALGNSEATSELELDDEEGRNGAAINRTKNGSGLAAAARDNQAGRGTFARPHPTRGNGNGIGVAAAGAARSSTSMTKPLTNPLFERLASQNKSLGLGALSHTREPAASGIQPSTITSAIRSQMISSTTAVAGAKAATSKEVQDLNRKVLQDTTNDAYSHAAGKWRQSHAYGQPARKALAATMHSRELHVARQGQGGAAAGGEEEEGDDLDEVEDDWAAATTTARPPHAGGVGTASRQRTAKRAKSPRKAPALKRDPKPGYCENCRDKFRDFDEVSRPALFPSPLRAPYQLG
ncbi:hypothetical protein KEM52_001959, partial [Ascosphaera acerosa]